MGVIIDNKETFERYKAMTNTERNIFNIKEKPHYKIKNKWDTIIKRGEEYIEVIKDTPPHTNNPTINNALNFLNTLTAKAPTQSVSIDTSNEAPATFDYTEWKEPVEIVGKKVIFVSEPTDITLEGEPLIIADTNDEVFKERTMDIYSYPSLDLERERQALTETLAELTKARQELTEARATAIKIISSAEADAQAERQITQAQAQSEAREIIADAQTEAKEIIETALGFKDGIDKERQLILSQARAERDIIIKQTKEEAEQNAQVIIKDGYEAQQSLIKRGGEEGERIERNVIGEANNYYKNKTKEADEYYKTKKDEADAYSPVITSEAKSSFYSDIDEIDGIYHLICEGLYQIDIDIIEGKKVLTIKNEEGNQVFRHRIS